MRWLAERLQKMGTLPTWRRLVNFWSVIFFLSIAYDFFTENSLSHNEALLAIAGIYGAALAIYSAEKEFRRWHDMHSSIHPGELYVILWTIIVAALVVGNALYEPTYHIPAEVSATYIGVIGILALTRESRTRYKRKKGRR